MCITRDAARGIVRGSFQHDYNTGIRHLFANGIFDVRYSSTGSEKYGYILNLKKFYGVVLYNVNEKNITDYREQCTVTLLQCNNRGFVAFANRYRIQIKIAIHLYYASGEMLCSYIFARFKYL